MCRISASFRPHVALGCALILLAACRPVSMPTAIPSVPPATLTPAVEAPVAQPAPSPTAGPSLNDPVTARVNLGQMPATLDPATVSPLDAGGNDLIENLFAGLAHVDPDAQRVEPALARGWEQLSDGITWYVYLRDDVFWVRVNPDSEEVERVRPITAADVVFAVQRACRADVPVPLGSRPAIFLIQGCREVYEMDPTTLTAEFVASTLGVRVLNDIVVEFKLTSDTAVFPTLLALPMLYPAPAELVKADVNDWASPDTIWTSGPYAILPAALSETSYTLVINPFWPLERDGNVEVVQVTFDAAAENAYHAWQSGALDLTVIPASELASMLPETASTSRLLARPMTVFLAAMYDSPPLDNADVRRALALALDREALIREMLLPDGQAALPASAIIPPGTVAAPPYGETGQRYNPDAARAALAQAGYPGCVGLPPITLLTDDVSDLLFRLMQRIVAMWEEVLGCQGVFTIARQPRFDVYNTARSQPVYDVPRPGLIVLGWQADYPDAHHWLADLFACREFFPTAYLDLARPCIEADGQVLDAFSLHDDEARTAIYATVEDAFFGPAGEMPVIPLYFYARAFAVQPWLTVYPLYAGPLRFDRWTIAVEQRP